jgi:hypothetical protein
MSGLEEHDEAPLEVEEDTLSLALADAWDASESTDATEQQGGEVHQPDSESTTSTTSEFGSGNAGADKQGTDGTKVPQEEGAAGTITAENSESGKPPVGLSLEAREAWNDVPDAVKADIVKRENDYAAGIEKHRQNSSRAEGMDRALAPFSQYLQMNGGPGQALKGLLETGSHLQMGSPQQKAQVVAQLINQFGVDVKTLDSMLVGEAPSQESQQQNQFQQMINQQMAPVQQQLQGYQQREQQQHQQQQQHINQEINSFGATHEFYHDVRGQMADLMDMAANANREMNMEEAYNLACSATPQIAGIMSGRANQQTVAGKRQAASSIQGSPGGAGATAAPNSTMAALNAAWDNAGQM